MNAERRRTLLAVLVIAGAVALLLATVGGSRDEIYGLDSAAPAGYRGLRLVLERFGVKVEQVDAADLATRVGEGDVVFVPRTGGATDATRRTWEDVAGRGVRVVLAGPGPAPGVPSSPESSFGYVQTRGVCGIAALGDVEAVRIDFETLLDARPADVAGSCLGTERGAVVVTRTVGRSEVISVASADLFTNDRMRGHTYPEKIDQFDNSVLAVRLFALEGTRRLVVVRGGVVAGNGTKSTWDFLSSGWQLGLAQLVAVGLFVVWWKGVRHGRVVSEPLPVEIAGSELVDAVGDLLRRQGHPDRAAATVRRESRRELCAALGIDRETPDEVVASLVANRIGRPQPEVLAALSGRAVSTDDDLVAVARELSSIRQEVLRV